MNQHTTQEQFWMGEFGADYTSRNAYDHSAFDDLYVRMFGRTRSSINQPFLQAIPRSSRVLEVGCNIGLQLRELYRSGFSDLYGIDVQRNALAHARTELPYLNLVFGSALEIPFRDNYFDVVYTSGVLIHISPSDLPTALAEMHRVSRRWIWGYEYYSPEVREISYRGNANMLWKADYRKLFLDQFADLREVRTEMLPYIHEAELGNTDCMYLLEKSA